MKTNPHPSRSGQIPRQRAFSLTEVLVVVALLSVIVLGLLAMFDQTTRAWRVGTTQTDVLEAGRAAMDMLAREMEQIRPAPPNSSNVTFCSFIPPVLPLLVPLPGSTPARVRTNVQEDLFFLRRENQTWTGTGYRVSDPALGLGSLYRFTTNVHVRTGDTSLIYDAYNRAAITNMSPIVDGVIHFRIRAFDIHGRWITDVLRFNTDVRWSAFAPADIGLCRFTNNAVPAVVEIELGVVEPRVADRFRSLATANPAAARTYLENQAGRIHMFRQRVPVPNVDPTAYQ